MANDDINFLLDHLKEAVANQWDGVVLVDGIEGSGKTNLAFNSAYYVDKSFCLDRVVFTPEQFFKAVDEAKPGQAIVWDEFINGGMSTDFLAKAQKSLIKKMVMIRKKNLYFFWVVPYYFMLGRYFSVARSRFLLHAYTPDGIKRGYWQSWNYERKKVMYFRGRKEFDYCEKTFSSGTFKEFFKEHPGIIDKEAYELKKDEASRSVNDENEDTGSSLKYKNLNKCFNTLTKYLRDNNIMSVAKISRVSGRPLQTLYNHTNKELGDDEFH